MKSIYVLLTILIFLVTIISCDVNSKKHINKEETLLLCNAAHDDGIEGIRRVLDSGVNINVSWFSSTVLSYCITIKVDKEIVEYLLSNGADGKFRNRHGSTVLMIAAGENNPEAVQLLLQYNADVNAKNSKDETALMEAKHVDITSILLENGAEVDAKDKIGLTALMHRARRRVVYEGVSYENQNEAMKVLLQYGANVNMKSKQGFTALMLASASGVHNNTEAVKILIEYGAHVNIRTKQNETALTATCAGKSKDSAEKVKILLEYGANVNVKTKQNKTALMFATSTGKTEIVELLRTYGAN